MIAYLLAAFLGAMTGTTVFTWAAVWYLHRLFHRDADIEKVQITIVRRNQ